MIPDDANAQAAAEPAARSASSPPRSSGRSRHSRGRRRPRRSTNRPRQSPEVRAEATGPDALEPKPLSPPFQPAKASSIQMALEKVTAIIGDLRDVLNDMELVLEYLEDAERQQIADEREIESLHQRLNMIHRRVDRHSTQSRSAQKHVEETAEAAS